MDEDIRLAIVVNEGLQMPPGKLGGQIGHAVHYSIKEHMTKYDRVHSIHLREDTPFMKWWLSDLHKKIVLKVSSDSELFDLQREAEMHMLSVSRVTDRALTFFKVPTVTCIAIGPDHKHRIDTVTGDLRLL